MNSIAKRALRNGLILGLFVCLAWSVIACGNGDVQRPEPDQDATIVAAAVKTTLEAIATAEAAEAPTATPAPAPQTESHAERRSHRFSDPGFHPGGRGCRNRRR